jgi:hypothetical protein
MSLESISISDGGLMGVRGLNIQTPLDGTRRFMWVLIHNLNGDVTEHLQEEMTAGILGLRKIKARKRNSLRTKKTKKNANHS